MSPLLTILLAAAWAATTPPSAASSRAPEPIAPVSRPPADSVPPSTCAAGRTLQNIPVLQCELRFEERDITYYVYVPPIYDGRRAVPAVLLLHGRGASGREMIAAWKKLAEAGGFMLLAPTLPSSPALEPKMPALLHALLASALQQRKIDAHRIYLFGHSLGGFFAFEAALLDPDIYAAAAIHASVLDPTLDELVKRARRKVPIVLQIGDSDPYFSLDRARRTRDVLVASGYDLQYIELLHHNHDYAPVAEKVNDLAWTFLRRHSLP